MGGITLATRAVEQGMEIATLSKLLGHYSTAFTMDVYVKVLPSQKIKEMQLMDELYQESMIAPSNIYPVILTPDQNGRISFSVPDFPEIVMDDMDFNVGIQLIKEKIAIKFCCP